MRHRKQTKTDLLLDLSLDDAANPHSRETIIENSDEWFHLHCVLGMN
jgi:hypothetical protein